MLEERQQTNVTAAGDTFQNGDIAISRVQLYHVVENIGHSFASQKQVHQFLFCGMFKRRNTKNPVVKCLVSTRHQYKTDAALIKVHMYQTLNLGGGFKFRVRIRIVNLFFFFFFWQTLFTTKVK